MLKSDFGDFNYVKCIVCLVVKGKEVILESKSYTVEKHVRKTKAVWDMPHLGKKGGEFYVNKKWTHAKNKVIYC